jgi:hypothetical protein
MPFEAILIPRERIRQEVASKIWLPPDSGTMMLPPGLSDETVGVLKKAVTFSYESDPEIEDLVIQHDGGPEALSPRFHPMPDGMDPIEWRDITSRLLVHVNLIKAAVRTLRSAVYGGQVRRTIVANPYAEELKRMIGRKYPSLMRSWFNSRVLTGTAAAISVINRTGKMPKLDTWLPYPPRTYVFVSPHDVSEYIGLVEFSADGETMRFVTRDAMGFIRKYRDPILVEYGDEIPLGAPSVIQITDLGFFPGVVAHGHDCRHRGSGYGLSLVREGVKGATRATDCLLNASLLQKKQTRAILWAKDEDPAAAEQAVESGRRLGGVVVGGKDFSMGYATPDSRITDTLEVLRAIIFTESLALGIPVDDLYQNTGVDSSAEAARRRAVPLTSLTQELSEAVVIDEEELVLRATALWHWYQTGEAVDLDEFSAQVETEIVMSPTVFPESNNEKVANAIALNTHGAMTDEDAAWAFNGKKTPEQVKEIAAEIQRRRELKEAQGVPGVGGAQEAMQAAASAQNT